MCVTFAYLLAGLNIAVFVSVIIYAILEVSLEYEILEAYNHAATLKVFLIYHVLNGFFLCVYYLVYFFT